MKCICSESTIAVLEYGFSNLTHNNIATARIYINMRVCFSIRLLYRRMARARACAARLLLFVAVSRPST